MLCRKCGAEIPDGNSFCGKCGMQNNFVKNVEPKQEVPNKKKKWIPWVIVGSVVVLIGSMLLVAMLIIGFFVIRGVGGSETLQIQDVPTENIEFPSFWGGNLASDTEKDRYTVFVYLVGTDLESGNINGQIQASAATDLVEMAQCTYGEDVNLIVQSGGCSNWAYEFMSDGDVQRFEILGDGSGTMNELMNLGSVSMVDPATLTDFLTWGQETYPAEHYAMICWDHGGGIPVSFGCDEIYADDMLSPSEMRDAVAASGIHLDFLGFDACLTGTLEMAIAMSQSADYLIASETLEPGNGWDYSYWLTTLGENPDMSTEEIGTKIVDDYFNYYYSQQYGDGVNLSVIDLSKIGEVKVQYERYMELWDAEMAAGKYEQLYSACSNSVQFPSADTIDLISLANQTSIDNATQLVTAVQDAVVYTNGNMPYAYGLSTYFPLNYPASYATDVRDEFIEIGLSNGFISGMDTYISLYCSYCIASGVDYDFSSISNAEWYDGATIGVFSGQQQMLTAGGLDGNSYLLNVDTSAAEEVIPVTSADWNIIQRIESQLYFLDGDNLYQMGSDDLHWLDTNGNIIAECPEFWLAVDAQTVCYNGLIAYSDPVANEWYTYGIVYATLNGDYSHMIGMVIYWSNEIEDGKILGYYDLDSTTLESDGILKTFATTDTVEFLYVYTNLNTQQTQFQVLGGTHSVSDPKFIPVYGPISNFDILISNTQAYNSFTITDIYGQEYETELLVK